MFELRTITTEVDGYDMLLAFPFLNPRFRPAKAPRTPRLGSACATWLSVCAVVRALHLTSASRPFLSCPVCLTAGGLAVSGGALERDTEESGMKRHVMIWTRDAVRLMIMGGSVSAEYDWVNVEEWRCVSA